MNPETNNIHALKYIIIIYLHGATKECFLLMETVSHISSEFSSYIKSFSCYLLEFGSKRCYFMQVII